MKLVALLLLLLQNPKPLDPTVATCQELVFTSRDEVDELILQIRQFASEKRPSSGTPAGPIQLIQGKRIENLMFEAKPKAVEEPTVERLPKEVIEERLRQLEEEVKKNGAEAPTNKSDSPQ